MMLSHISTLPTARWPYGSWITWPPTHHWQSISVPSQVVQMHTWVWGSERLGSSTPFILLEAKVSQPWSLRPYLPLFTNPIHDLLGNTSFLSCFLPFSFTQRPFLTTVSYPIPCLSPISYFPSFSVTSTPSYKTLLITPALCQLLSIPNQLWGSGPSLSFGPMFLTPLP